MSESRARRQERENAKQFDLHHEIYGDYMPAQSAQNRETLRVTAAPQVIELRAIDLRDNQGTLSDVLYKEIADFSESNGYANVSTIDTRAIIFTGDPGERGAINTSSPAADTTAAEINKCRTEYDMQDMGIYIRRLAVGDITYPLLVIVGYNGIATEDLHELSNLVMPIVSQRLIEAGHSIDLPAFK